MKIINSNFLIFSIILSNSCIKNIDNNAVELKDNFSEAEFKNALIGEWQSVFEHTGEENVLYLKLDKLGKVKITIRKEGIETEYSGNYTINFTREASEESVTLANIIITENGDTDIVLSMVNFGLHNAFPEDSELFLRIDESPFGVLKRLE